MKINVILTNTFLKSIEKIKDKTVENQILQKLTELENTPELGKKLKYGLKGYYQLRIGKTRILYTIKGNKIFVEILVRKHKYKEIN